MYDKSLSGTWRVRLFGSLEVLRGTEDFSRFPTRKSEKLFALMALQPRKFHQRATLADALWPGRSETSSRKRLRTELWVIRKFLETKTGDLFDIRPGGIGLHPSAAIWIDVDDLETSLRPFEGRAPRPSREDCQRLERALSLYRGELLEGHYEEWCLEARESLKMRLLAALEQLMVIYLRQEAWIRAIGCGRRILRLEPLTETVHRDLMRCYFESGDRAAALRQYRQCTALLRSELDVPPMYETAHLYERIKVHRGPGRLMVGESMGEAC